MDLDGLESRAATCTACELHKGRKVPVFAKGNPEAGIMICGMVPADEENKAGLPFVGRAGKLLDQILKDAGLSLDDVYITNLVKCYLAAGKLLEQDWIDNCLPFLLVQRELVQPNVIITLGKDAAVTLLAEDPKKALGKIRSSGPYKYDLFELIPTYHPSYLLRGGGTGHRSYNDVVGDFIKAKEVNYP